MRKFQRLLLITLFFFFKTFYAQDFKDYISAYTGENGKGYLQPLADAFSADVNSGFYQTAYIPEKGISVYLGVVAMTAIIPNDSRLFKAKTGEFFTPKTTLDAPTIFGPTNSVNVDGNNGLQYTFPGGLDIKKLPIAVPQLTIGSIKGTDLTIRYIQLNVNKDFGEINVFGIGVRHNINQYFIDLPVNIAAGLYYQKFKIGNIISANSIAVNLQTSYSYSLITLYGGLGYENSLMNVSYKIETDTDSEKVNFDVNAANSIRLTLGLAFNLSFFKIFTDYSLASQNVWTVGLGFYF